MIGEYETKRNQSYDFFFVCPECKSIYEGTRDRNNIVLKSRWWNSKKKEFEDINKY